MNDQELHWPLDGRLDSNGILVGCDENQEWLLPWWWDNYRNFNGHPVSFVDLGMSEKGRRWCEDKGEIILCEHLSPFAALKEEIEPGLASHWEKIYGDGIWTSRSAWFKKPISMMQSPYKKTIWMDLDCEVLSPLSSMFSYCDCPSGVSAAKETTGSQMKEMSQGFLLQGETLYNSGVVVFARQSPLIFRWAQESLMQSQRFWGDEQLLSRIIFKERFSIRELPDIYNWRMSQGLNLNAAIVHWVGGWGKSYIKKHGGIRRDIENFYQSINCLP